MDTFRKTYELEPEEVRLRRPAKKAFDKEQIYYHAVMSGRVTQDPDAIRDAAVSYNEAHARLCDVDVTIIKKICRTEGKPLPVSSGFTEASRLVTLEWQEDSWK